MNISYVHVLSREFHVAEAPPKALRDVGVEHLQGSTKSFVTRGNLAEVICPSNLLERSVALSDELQWKHAPNICILAADVATNAYGLSLGLFLFYVDFLTTRYFHVIYRWYNEVMFQRILTLVTLAAAIALLFTMQTINPSTAGPVGILAVFFLLYLVVFGCLTRIIHLLGWLGSRLAKPVLLKRPIQAISLSHSAYLASIIAIAPIMVIAISSVGKMGIYEFFLVLLFISLGVFYVEKRLG